MCAHAHLCALTFLVTATAVHGGGCRWGQSSGTQRAGAYTAQRQSAREARILHQLMEFARIRAALQFGIVRAGNSCN